jgi:hypothetical protein
MLSLKLLPGDSSNQAVPSGIWRKKLPLRIGTSVSKLRLALVLFVWWIPTKKLPGPTATGLGRVMMTGPAAVTVLSEAST